MPKTKQAKTEATKQTTVETRDGANFERTRAVAHLGLGTADVVATQISNIFTDYVLGANNPDPRIMLSAIGKRLNLESLKLRAVQIAHSQGRTKRTSNTFFLNA